MTGGNGRGKRCQSFKLYTAPICTFEEFVTNINYIKRISLLSQAPEAVFVYKRIVNKQTTEDLQITNIFLNVPIGSTNSLLFETYNVFKTEDLYDS